LPPTKPANTSINLHEPSLPGLHLCCK